MLQTFYSIRKLYYLLIAAIGFTVNVVAIAILSRGKCGLSRCTTRYLVAMAAADLLAVVTAVLMRINYYFPGSFLEIYPLCSIIFVLQCATRDCSVWFTVAFTFDRCIAICYQKLKTKFCRPKTAALVMTTTCILMCLKNIPFYFIYTPRQLINNVLWYCKLKSGYYTESGWIGFDKFNKSLTPLIPFALIFLLNGLTIRHILVASRVRKGLKGGSKGENRSDPEMEGRRKSVILFFTISGSFIILWSATVIHFIIYSIAGEDPDKFNDDILGYVGYMLQNLSMCTNTFIYGVTQSKFREQLINAIKYQVTSILRFTNDQNR